MTRGIHTNRNIFIQNHATFFLEALENSNQQELECMGDQVNINNLVIPVIMKILILYLKSYLHAIQPDVTNTAD